MVKEENGVLERREERAGYIYKANAEGKERDKERLHEQLGVDRALDWKEVSVCVNQIQRNLTPSHAFYNHKTTITITTTATSTAATTTATTTATASTAAAATTAATLSTTAAAADAAAVAVTGGGGRRQMLPKDGFGWRQWQ